MRFIFLLLALTFNMASHLLSCDLQLSYKNYINWDFNNVTWLSLSSKTICVSFFYNEKPNAAIFPSTMTGVTFKGCDLKNAVIPPGNFLIDCDTRTFETENDLEEWVVDSVTLKPIEPLYKTKFIYFGISTDPKDIPVQKLSEPVSEKKKREKDMIQLIEIKQKEILELQAQVVTPPPPPPPVIP